jgi:hypothetical protein
MQKKNSKKVVKDNKTTVTELNYKSFTPVAKNGWYIKFSTLDANNILLIFVSSYTMETIVRYFSNEEMAVEFINFVITSDPQDLLFI